MKIGNYNGVISFKSLASEKNFETPIEGGHALNATHHCVPLPVTAYVNRSVWRRGKEG